MNRKIFTFGIILFFSFCNFANAWRFLGSTYRWPSNQTRSIVIGAFVYVADGVTITVYNKETLTPLDNFVRLPIENGEGIYALVPDDYTNPEILYAACGEGGIHVIDLDDPENPTTTGTTPKTHSTYLNVDDNDDGEILSKINAFDISINGSLMYVADNDYGIRIFSLEDPTGPNDVGLPGLQTSSTGIMRYASVYEHSSGLYLFALTSGDLRYYKLENSGKSIIAKSVLAADVSSAGGLASLTISQTLGYAYFTDQTNKNLYIFNIKQAISQNTEPQQIYPSDQYDDLSFGFPRGFDISTDKLYMTSFYPENEGPTDSESTYTNAPAGLHIIDITNGYNPTQTTDDVYRLNYSGSVAVSTDDYAYLYSLQTGMHRININYESDNYLDLVGGPQDTKLNAVDVCVAYEYAFVVDGIDGSDYGFTIINVDDPDHPYYEGFFATPGQANAVYIEQEGYRAGAIADGTEGIQIITFDSSTGMSEPDFADPITVAAGQSVKTVTGVYPYYHIIAVVEDTADSANNEIWTIDLFDSPTDPGTPVKLTAPGAVDVHAYGTYAFIAAGANGLTIMKVLDSAADPMTPEGPYTVEDEPAYTNVQAICTGSIEEEETGTVGTIPDDTEEGTYAFVADGPSVKIIELYSDELNFTPKYIGSIDLSEYGNAIDIIFSEKTIYIMTDSDEYTLLVYDVSTPSLPVFQDSKKTYGEASGFCIYDVVVVDTTDVTGQRTVKAVYVAENSGYLSIHETTEDEENPEERKFTNGSDAACFTDTASNHAKNRISFRFLIPAVSVSVIIFIIAGMILYNKRSE